MNSNETLPYPTDFQELYSSFYTANICLKMFKNVKKHFFKFLNIIIIFAKNI